MEKIDDDDDVNINECHINDLLSTLFRLQSQRCSTYQRLDDAQLMFFNTHNFPAFQNFLSDITVIFARISEEILLIKKRFENKKLIFKHIEQLQDYEQNKLQLTNDLFVAKVEKKNDQIEGIQQKLIELIDNINEVLEELRYDQEEFSKIMSDNIQQTIVDLLNQASLYGKDNIRVQHLRRIQELILRKDPNLLDQFLEEVLSFQTDKSVEVKKTIISFIEEACQYNPKIIIKVIDNLHFLLYDDNIFVQKKFILSFISIYKSTLLWLLKSRFIDESVDNMWRIMTNIKTHIIHQLNSDNDGLCVVVIKFIEMLIIILSEHKQDFLVNDQKILSQIELEQEEKDMIEKLFHFILCQHLSNVNLIATIETITIIARYKSDYLIRVVETFEYINENLPSTLIDSQISNIHKIIKLKLFNLLKYSVLFDLQPRIINLLNNLGATQTEIVKHLPKTFSETKRKFPSNNHHTKKPKNINDDKNNNFTEKETSSTHLQYQKVTDLIKKLSLQNVVDLVLVSMHSLPEKIPASFQSIYTPIVDAGSPTQIEYLARLLSTQLTSIDYKIIIENNDSLSSRTSSLTLVNEISSTSTTIPIIPNIQSKKTKSFKFFNAIKSIEYNEMQRMSIDSFYRILDATDICEKAGVSHIHKKIIHSLVCLSEQSFCDIYKDYIISDLHQRYDLAFTWLYSEYIQYLTIFEENKKKDFTKYDYILCQLLEYLQEKDNHLFSRLIINVPLITDNSLIILKRYCSDEGKNNFGMNILFNLIIYRIPIREKCLDILIYLTKNENNFIRNNAIDIVKNLYQKNQFKQLIERYVLQVLQMLEVAFDVSSSDIQFLIPILTNLEKCEILSILPKLIKLSPSIVKEVFNQLLGLNHHTSSISPSELLIALHRISLEECELKTIINATSLCFNERSIYTDNILAEIIQQLVEITPIPLLFMRTVLQTLNLYPKLIHFIMNILQRLIKKQVWNQARIWEGFIKCCEKTQPYSFPLLLQLPPSQLKHVFQIASELHDSLRHHLRSMSIAQRSSIPLSILTVIEDNSEVSS